MDALKERAIPRERGRGEILWLWRSRKSTTELARVWFTVSRRWNLVQVKSPPRLLRDSRVSLLLFIFSPLAARAWHATLNVTANSEIMRAIPRRGSFAQVRMHACMHACMHPCVSAYCTIRVTRSRDNSARFVRASQRLILRPSTRWAVTKAKCHSHCPHSTIYHREKIQYIIQRINIFY